MREDNGCLRRRECVERRLVAAVRDVNGHADRQDESCNRRKRKRRIDRLQDRKSEQHVQRQRDDRDRPAQRRCRKLRADRPGCGQGLLVLRGDQLRGRQLRDRAGRGRRGRDRRRRAEGIHTTRDSVLIKLDMGGYLADTPVQ